MKQWQNLLAMAALAIGMTAAGMPSFAMPPREPSPATVRQMHSGHSLSDAYGSGPWPGRLIIATDRIRGSDPHRTIHRSSIPGGSLRWRWENKSYDPDAREQIADYELLVTTEGVPTNPDPDEYRRNSLDALDRWVDHAWKNGNGGKGAEVMIYSTWTFWRHSDGPPDYDREHAIPFRQRLDVDGERWERMQDSANENRPDGMPLIYMIPGHRLMMQIYDDIETGKAPGLANIGDIFMDDIHLNDLGQYAITCLVFAVIYQRDPAMLPNRLAVPEDTLSPEQAAYFKAVAWDVARSYSRSGVPADAQ